MTTPNSFALTLILSFGLVACGGGGGDSTNVDTNVGTNTAATYAPGSAELGGWNVLQGARTLCGFGALTRNSKLDAVALNHAKYLVDLSIATGTSELSHLETPGVDGFTGIFPWDRTQAAGYGTRVAEILEATVWDYVNPPTFPSMEERGANSMHSLLNTVYHLSGAMYEGAEAGFGAYMKTTLIDATTWREEYRFGSLNGYETKHITLGAGQVVTYPCQGSSDVPTFFIPANESPNPFPAMTLDSQKVGPPIYLKVDAAQVLQVTSSNVSLNGVSVPTTLLTHTNDPNIDVYGKPYIDPNEVFVIPMTALLPNSYYQVTLTGTVNSLPFNRSFTMRTGL